MGRSSSPLTFLRRLDFILEPTKEEALATHAKIKGETEDLLPVLRSVTGIESQNTSKHTIATLLDDPANVAQNLRRYIGRFDPGTRQVSQQFYLAHKIARLDHATLIYKVLGKVAEPDHRPKRVSKVRWAVSTMSSSGRRTLKEFRGEKHASFLKAWPRRSIEVLGVHLDLADFRRASGLNPDLERRYEANRLTLIRQLD